MNIEEAYKNMLKYCPFKKGDKVKVLRKAESYEMGWNCSWCKEMDVFIGEIGIIDEITNYGIYIVFDLENLKINYSNFPFFVLEKIENVPEKVTYQELCKDLKPFDKILIRDYNSEEWWGSFFGKFSSEYSYIDLEGYDFEQCMPYEGNEKYFGTKNSPLDD